MRCQALPTSYLNWVMMIIHFKTLAVEEFEHGLASIFTDSVNTPELDTSFEPDTVAFSVSSGFLYLVSTLCNNS